MSKARSRSKLDRTIVLVGLMGAGKSAIGRRLASRLGVEFIDADHEIEKAAALSIPDIFEVHGEEAFRDGERRVIARLLAQSPHVLATGGGAFMDPAIRASIRERGVSVWLRAEYDVLLARVSRRNNRPMLKGGDKGEILKRLIEERYPVYAEADITVESREGPHDETVDNVVSELKDFLDSDADAPKEDT